MFNLSDDRKFPNVLDGFERLSAASERLRPPVIGRDAEIRAVLEALGGGEPVVLRGPSGVGKTAVWRGVAASAGCRDAPPGVAKLDILLAPVSVLQSGTPYNGWWEQKLSEIVADARASARAGRCPLLVISDFGNLWHVSRSSRDDARPIASDILPYVESGDLRIGGELTPDLFRPGLASDQRWLHRVRFIDVQPMAGEPLLKVVRIASALGAAGGRTGASARSQQIKKRIPEAWRRGEASTAQFEGALARAVELSSRFAANGVQPAAAVGLMRRALDVGPLGVETVEQALSASTGVPLPMISDSIPLSKEQVVRSLSARVVGQPDAVNAATSAILVAKAGLNDERRPLAVHLYVGPTGVGKTLMAKALAEYLFGSASSLVRLDMSEFFGASSAERFAEVLVARVADRPMAVVLFDEIEKADAGALDVLLQVNSDGLVANNKGRSARLTNSLIVMTSNAGAREASAPKRRAGLFPSACADSDGDTAIADCVTEALRQRFRPEFIGRIDHIVHFRPFDRSANAAIVAKELDLALSCPGLKRRGLTVSYGEEVVSLLIERGLDARYGARRLVQTVKDDVLVPLASWLAADPLVRDRACRLAVGGAGVSIEVDPMS